MRESLTLGETRTNVIPWKKSGTVPVSLGIGIHDIFNFK